MGKETGTPRHRLLREVFRHYTEFQQLFTSEGIDTIDYGGFSVSLWDLQDALKPQDEGGILSKRKLEAVYYNVVLDMKQKDVAKIMGITTVSVGQYVEQAMIQLSEKYFGDELVPKTRGKAYFSDFITEDNYVEDLAHHGPDGFAPFRDKWLSIQKKYGTDRYMQDYTEELDAELDDLDGTEGDGADGVFDPNANYSKAELEAWSDRLLREDSKRDMCRKCGRYGDPTGHIEAMPQFDKNENPILDESGAQLYVDFPELECEKGHRWFDGEGKKRGIGGDHPILFENHLQDRRRREIYTKQGTPDPSIKQGMYNRTHPQGRKVNSKDQRQKNGASWYR